MKKNLTTVFVILGIAILGILLHTFTDKSDTEKETPSTVTKTPREPQISVEGKTFDEKLLNIAQSGFSPESLATMSKEFWMENFSKALSQIQSNSESLSLTDLYEGYSNEGGKHEPFSYMALEVGEKELAGLGEFNGNPTLIKDLVKSFGLVVAGNGFGELKSLLSVGSGSNLSDALIYRVFKESMSTYVLDNSLQLPEEERVLSNETKRELLELSTSGKLIERLVVADLMQTHFISGDTALTKELLKNFEDEADEIVLLELSDYAFKNRTLETKAFWDDVMNSSSISNDRFDLVSSVLKKEAK